MSKVADILQKLRPIAEQVVTQDNLGTADAGLSPEERKRITERCWATDKDRRPYHGPKAHATQLLTAFEEEFKPLTLNSSDKERE